MIYRIALITILALTLCGLAPAAAVDTVDATAAWNAAAATYNFKATDHPDVTALTTFVQAYTGSDFEADFTAIIDAVCEALGSNYVPPFTGDDELSAELETWPLQ